MSRARTDLRLRVLERETTGLDFAVEAVLATKQNNLISGTNIKTVNGISLLGSGDLAVTAADTFETVSKNLAAEDATLAYSGGNLATITYASGVVKTLTYTDGDLTSIVLSGSTPGGIDLTKTLSYTGGNLTGITYS